METRHEKAGQRETDSTPKGTAASTEAQVRRQPDLFQEIMYLLIKLAVVALIATLLFTFIFGALRYNNGNMNPAVKEGDLVIYYRLDKDYKASETLVLKYEGEYQIQRVVAVAGDTVDIGEGGLMVNGAYQQESEIYTETERYAQGVEFPLTVPEGEVFVLSDNRTNATDSRLYGTVKIRDTYGTVMAIFRRRNL